MIFLPVLCHNPFSTKLKNAHEIFRQNLSKSIVKVVTNFFTGNCAVCGKFLTHFLRAQQGAAIRIKNNISIPSCLFSHCSDLWECIVILVLVIWQARPIHTDVSSACHLPGQIDTNLYTQRSGQSELLLSDDDSSSHQFMSATSTIFRNVSFRNDKNFQCPDIFVFCANATGLLNCTKRKGNFIFKFIE